MEDALFLIKLQQNPYKHMWMYILPLSLYVSKTPLNKKQIIWTDVVL